MVRQLSRIALVAAVVCACGGGGADEPAPPSGAEATGSDAPTAEADFSRDSFVLCAALESHREELASIVGFEQDPERGLSGAGSECIIRGIDGGFARVSLAPAVVPSIAMHVEGFDAEASAVSELGPDAMFVDAALQPHVVFSMGPLIIDVDAESTETPSRETMVELATRVREILTEANS